jgi:hypothetical protein
MMTAFSTVTPTPAPLDPSKHVSYALGMVLGVADFEQEFAYHSGRDTWLARDLVGSGTVRGLDVSLTSATSTSSPATTVTEVVVQPGVALTPQGQIVRIPSAQCAVLDDWIRDNQTTIATRFGSPPASPLPPTPGQGTIELYVVLRYKDTPTDQVPIPGEPCRTSDAAMAPSRITDGFSLDLAITPPAPTEEPGMRAVLDWLGQVPIVQGAGSGSVIGALKASFGIAGPLPPITPLALPPSPPAGVTIGTAAIEGAYAAVLQFYATTLRDLLAGSVTADAPPAETGVLLATVTAPVAQGLGGAWVLNGAAVVDTTRPFLLPLDLLKEAWLTSASKLARYRVVAAGVVPVGGPASPSAGGLQAMWLPSGEVLLTFPDAPGPATQYVVKALPYVAGSPAAPPSSVTLVITSIAISPPSATLAVFVGNVLAAGAQPPAGLNLVVEITAVARS